MQRCRGIRVEGYDILKTRHSYTLHAIIISIRFRRMACARSHTHSHSHRHSFGQYDAVVNCVMPLWIQYLNESKHWLTTKYQSLLLIKRLNGMEYMCCVCANDIYYNKKYSYFDDFCCCRIQEAWWVKIKCIILLGVDCRHTSI